MTDARLVAVDAGTLSARAGLFAADGTLIGAASAPYELLRPAENHAVYRMAGIWAAVCDAVRTAVGLERGCEVAALAFDATSSLALSYEGKPPLDGDADVFCWLDHRGEAEAAEIDATGDLYLDYVGGSVSPEVHLPKLLWLKRYRPEGWSRVTAARDLVDELAFRATGVDAHSICGFSCKWPFLPAAGGWRHGLLARIGIGELTSLGNLRAAPLATGAGHGIVSAQAAADLGLDAGTPVAVGLIDAEAGALGVLGRAYQRRMNRTLAVICGTSNSFMAFCSDERRIPGVWGPNRDPVFSGYWMHEAGQTLAGGALDNVLAHHPGGPRMATPDGHIQTARQILDLLECEGPAFAAGRHVVPDWLGNRSPLGDGRARAILTGIGEEITPRAFLESYYAAARAIVLQARHIAEHLNLYGYAIDRIALTGGQLKNPLLNRLYRDAVGFDVVLADHKEPVLLGTAMVAAVAAGLAPDLFVALDRMAPAQHQVSADPDWRQAHEPAYQVYRTLFDMRSNLNAIAHRASSRSRARPRGELIQG